MKAFYLLGLLVFSSCASVPVAENRPAIEKVSTLHRVIWLMIASIAGRAPSYDVHGNLMP